MDGRSGGNVMDENLFFLHEIMTLCTITDLAKQGYHWSRNERTGRVNLTT